MYPKNFDKLSEETQDRGTWQKCFNKDVLCVICGADIDVPMWRGSGWVRIGLGKASDTAELTVVSTQSPSVQTADFRKVVQDNNEWGICLSLLLLQSSCSRLTCCYS